MGTSRPGRRSGGTAPPSRPGRKPPGILGAIELHEPRPGSFRIQCTHEDSYGLIHALCSRLFRHFGADIHSLSANATRTDPVFVVHISLPRNLEGTAVRCIIGEES